MEIDQSYKPVLVKMVILLTIAWAIVVGGEASADPRFGGYEAVRVYLDEETSLVGWLDIKQLPADAMLQFATEKLGARIPVESAREIVALHELLRSAGVERIYFVGRAPLEIMTQGPLMVIPANSPESLDVSMASRIPPTISRRVDRGCVLLGQPQTLERAVLHPNRPRTELEAAIKDVGDAHGAAFVPTPFLRDSLNILAGASAKDPTMKVRLDAISGITSLVGRVKFPPEDLSIEATFDEALQANLVGDLVRDQMVAELGSDISPYLPVIVDRRIKLEAKSREQVENLLQKLAAPMRRSSDLAMEMNSMKQIALALHNYESATGSFPPQALVDGKGQRLLSWRVLILPYLEQDSLYRQFHLDEPWDSEHNRSLISKMPAVFRRSAAVNASEEKTPFLVPLAGNSIFGRPGRPARIRDVTDGTSQTIWLLRMPDEDAVVWTKPDDWVVPKEDPLKRFRESAEKLMVGRADGSVQILSSSLKPETVHALFSMDGAEPIHPSDLE